MQRLIAQLNRFLREEDSPTMVEYALLMALIALTAAVGAGFLGKHVRNKFKDVKDLLDTFGG